MRSFAHELARVLVSRYGREETYTPGRVVTALRQSRLSVEFELCAIAMFSTRIAFVDWLTLQRQGGAGDRKGWSALYDHLRHEAAVEVNDGSYSFVPREQRAIAMDNGDDRDAATRWGVGL